MDNTTPLIPTSSSESPQSSLQAGKKFNIRIVVIITIVLLACVGTSLYFILRSPSQSKSTKIKSSATATNPDASLSAAERKTLATLKGEDVTLISPPAIDLAPYSAVISATSSGYYQYNTQDQQCSFGFGTRSAQEQGGSSFTQMVGLLVDYFKSKDMQIESQGLGSPLVLNLTDDDAMQFTLPTAIIAVKDGHEAALQYFSAAILQNGNRISITRTCQFTSGVIDQTAMESIEATVRKITVQVTEP